jgi:hypothetical protein
MKQDAPDPRTAEVFRFAGCAYDPDTGVARLAYAFDDAPELVEKIEFPHAPWPEDPEQQAAFLRALELLHLLAGVSYYKAGLPPRIDTAELLLDAHVAGFVTETWVQGLAEFAHRNGLDMAGRVQFSAKGELHPVKTSVKLPERALVAMGGGKDSLVCLEVLRTAGVEVLPFTVGNSALIRETVAVAGLPLVEIRRELAPGLMAMNAAGAWNGHVPITAINSVIGLCAALLYGARSVVFANERSAEEATLFDAQGHSVNHQYSKSLAFERALREVVMRQVTAGLDYFSLLRPLGELGVTRRFALLRQYHAVFSSCNRNFHRDGPRISNRWCGDCPKCRFTSLALAPFLPPGEVSAILGQNLLDVHAQQSGFRELCGLGADKPFECVGTVAESRAALSFIARDPAWRSCAVVQVLAPLVADAPSLDSLLLPDGPHCIPQRLFQHVVF